MRLGPEPLFGRGERLYQQPDEEEEAPHKPPQPERTLTVPEPAPKPAERPQPEPAAETEVGKGNPIASTLLELAGIASISTGGFLVATWLGCMILGVCLVVLGVALGS